MQYWLVKTEPSAWSWDDQRKAGGKGEPWTGVRNHTAKQNLAKMHKGDQAFFYHSVDEKSIVGLVKVTREAYPDPTAKPGEPWVVVDVKAVAPLPHPVTLADIKAEPRPVSKRREGVPVEVDQLLVRALAKHPRDRFTTAAQMRIAVLTRSNRQPPRKVPSSAR